MAGQLTKWKQFRIEGAQLLLIFIVIQLLIVSSESGGPLNENKRHKILCYQDSRLGWGFFEHKGLKTNRINASLCTHVIWGFASINNESLIQVDANQNLGGFHFERVAKMFQETVALKKSNPNLKVLLSLGGWNYNSSTFRQIIREEKSRTVLVKSTVDFLRKHDLDGLDVFPENPGHRGDPAFREDKSYLLIMFKELRDAFGPFNFTLCASLPAKLKSIVPNATSASRLISKMAKYLDFINILAFDLNGSWMNVSVHHAPLYAPPNQREHILSIDQCVQDWLSTDIPRDKLILGLSSFGRSFLIKNKKDRCPLLYSPIDGVPVREYYILKDGITTYGQVTSNIQCDDFDYKWLDFEQVPYVFSYWNQPMFTGHAKRIPLQWIGFDDVKSIDAKVKYLLKVGLGGAMLFSLDGDCFTDFCERFQGRFPLLRVINHHLNKNLSVEFPQADMLFNLTWEKMIREKQEHKLIQSYIHSRGPNSSNATVQEKRLCNCKRGSVVWTSGTKKVEINCDDKELEKIDLEDVVEYEKLMVPGSRLEHKLFHNERVSNWIEQNKRWYQILFESIANWLGFS